MTSPHPGSAIFLDQLQFPLDPDAVDFGDPRIIVVKKDPQTQTCKNVLANYLNSVAPPQFQRPESWSPADKKAFWKSLLMNRIEGVIVLVDITRAIYRLKQISPEDRALELFTNLLEAGYEYIVLDGNNRLKFLLALFNDEWAIPEGDYEYIRDLQDLSTCPLKVTRKRNKFSDLPEIVKTVLKNRTCIVSEYTQIGYAGLSDIFLNTNSGVFPNNQELRNASKTLWADYVRYITNNLTQSGLLNLIMKNPNARYAGQDWVTECLDFVLQAVDDEVVDGELTGKKVFKQITQPTKNTLYTSTFLNQSCQEYYTRVFNDLSQYLTKMVDERILTEKTLRKMVAQNLFWMMCHGVSTYDQAVEAIKLHEQEYTRKDKFFTDVKDFVENEEVVGDDLTFKNSCEGSRKLNIEHRYLILLSIVREVTRGLYDSIEEAVEHTAPF